METGLVTTDKNQKLQAFLMSPIEYCRAISDNVVNIKQVLVSPCLSLFEIQQSNPTELNAVITKFIEGMLLFHGRNRTDMNSFQVLKVVQGITETYPYLSIEDVCLCFKMARNDSRYKGFYGVIDGKVIMQWFSNYDIERASVCESLPNNVEVKLSGEEITADEYEGLVLSSIAAGESESYPLYKAILERKKMLSGMKSQVANYNQNQKHRYDNPNYILGFPTNAVLKGIRAEKENKKPF